MSESTEVDLCITGAAAVTASGPPSRRSRARLVAARRPSLA